MSISRTVGVRQGLTGFDGDRARRARCDLGLTQHQLAQWLGVHTRSVALWERGQASPDAHILPKLAGVLGLTPSALSWCPARFSLADLRIVAGLHQAEAARELGLTVRQLGDLERGLESLSDPLLRAMALTYHCDPEQVRAAAAMQPGSGARPRPPIGGG